MSRRAGGRREGEREAALSRRIARVDWNGVLLGARECAALARGFDDDARYRSTVDMAPRSYGSGVYRYFADPLPPLVAALREQLYAPLAAIANAWAERLGSDERFPGALAGLRARCREAGQLRPTPLLLRYAAGDYNRLHQDRYGRVAFPLQVVIPLSRPGLDYQGGEFLLVEQWPRKQSKGAAVALARGEALVFPNAVRPALGPRGAFRVQVRHGLSEVLAGQRVALGIIFHDAE